MKSAREVFLELVQEEVDRAYRKHGRDPWGRHEFYGVLLEEVDELWDAIKTNAPNEEMYAEMVQVAAMCLRFFETGDRYGTAPKAKIPAGAVDIPGYGVVVPNAAEELAP
jgi:NTP pyrophosphatase (non-canonical NTP hydrolase)